MPEGDIVHPFGLVEVDEIRGRSIIELHEHRVSVTVVYNGSWAMMAWAAVIVDKAKLSTCAVRGE
jgi:hypothetical protein